MLILVKQNVFVQAKYDPSHVTYHYDHSLKPSADRWNQFNQTERMPVKETKSTNLQRHDLFPAFVN